MGVAVLALGWTVAGVITVVLLLLLAHGFFVPECVSYDRDGQRVARVGLVVVAVLLLALWVMAVRALRIARSSLLAHVLLAVALPVVLVASFAAGTAITDQVVQRAAPSGDHAMCW